MTIGKKRRQNFENIAWFFDLRNRTRIDLDPPFQRRSVWNHRYREEFIDTILMDYPAPAIFLYTDITELGSTTYQVVDGKQRLTTVFAFLADEFPVSAKSPVEDLRGKYFRDLTKEQKVAFYEYDFSVEYLPTNDDSIINNIFDRLNRNVARLTAQELRHARFNGSFIKQTELLQEWMTEKLGKQFPRITDASRRQMKDVEVVATLLLFLEEGVKGYSTLALDQAFSDRDEEWEKEPEIVDRFKETIRCIAKILNSTFGQHIVQSRFRNQADFYSLFAAIAELSAEATLPDNPDVIAVCLKAFADAVDDEETRKLSKSCSEYFEAARSASNDAGPRRVRINAIRRILLEQELDLQENDNS